MKNVFKMIDIQRRLSVTAAALCAASAPAQTAPAPVPFTYADLADRALAGPVAMTAIVTGVTRLKPDQSPGLAPGHARLLVDAQATSLIRGPAGVPPRVRYLADVPLDEKGRAPRLARKPVLLLAKTVATRPGELQLVAPDAQLPLENAAATEATIRRILVEASGPDAPPAVTGISGAFHVPGTIQGEAESQIFLSTAAARPISLTVLRRPGQEKSWAVALTEIVDERAEPPARDTLLWYRLACGLPRRLPNPVTASLPAAEAEAVRQDYRFVLDKLGPCTRNRPVKA